MAASQTAHREKTLSLRAANLQSYLWACLAGLGLGLATLISPLLGLGVILGIIFSYIALTRPIFLCYGLVAATVFLGGLQRGRFLPLLVPSEAVLLVSAGLCLPIIIVAKRPRI